MHHGKMVLHVDGEVSEHGRGCREGDRVHSDFDSVVRHVRTLSVDEDRWTTGEAVGHRSV